jgi:putative resolvase
MKLKEWAIANNIHPQTAYRWFREGTLPVRAERVGPRVIMVYPDPPSGEKIADTPGAVGLYARVSSHDQRDDLTRQMDRLTAWAHAAGATVTRKESEVGSGMNGDRTKVRRLLSDPEVKTVVVEHRDRLGRMNIDLVEAAMEASGRTLIVLNEDEVEDDLVRDMTEILTSFCARLYGRRSAKNRAERALECAALEIADA